MEPRDLALVAAEWEANLLRRERIPALAIELILAGYDTPSLRVAAGLLPGELYGAHELFGRTLAELGDEREQNARGRGGGLARELAARGLDSRMPLVEAVNRICALSLDFDDEEWALSGDELTAFVVLADLWDDRPAERARLERDLRQELQSLFRRL